jgi:hypothetical protein
MRKIPFNKFTFGRYIPAIFLLLISIIVLSLVIIIGKELFRPSYDMGILLVTPGYSQAAWNQPVYELFSNLNSPYPVRLAFLGFVPEHDIQRQLKELVKEKISRIRIIPLFVFTYQSHTPELLDILGVKNRCNVDRGIRQKKYKIPLEITGGLDFSSLIGDILAERFRELSKKPEEETAVYFIYGAVKSEVAEHQKNKEIMQKYVSYLKEKGLNFSDSIFVWAVHEPDWSQLQKIIEENIRKGKKVNIVPFLLFPKGQIDFTIQSCVDLALMNTGAKPQDIRYNGKTLYPHKNLIKWIESQVTNPKMIDKEFYQIAN